MTQKGKRRVKSNLDFPSVYQASEASVPLKERRRKKKRQERRKTNLIFIDIMVSESRRLER
jgi:hypothetical protein